jgi:diacylglycerol kinase family enzyme
LGVESKAALMATGAWVAIANPRSHGGFSPSALRRLASDLHAVVDTMLVSERAGHVDALVCECRGADGILIGGGDGTIFEVLQACDRARQRLAVLPFGRGNSLARDLALDTATTAIRSLTSGVDRVIDLLSVVLRYEDSRCWEGVSASNLAIGYPAAVAKDAAKWRRLRGHGYTVAGLLTRPTWFDVRITMDDAPEGPARMTGLIISNSRYVGPFLGFPSADLSDGIFHGMELRARRFHQVLHNLSSVTGLRFYEPVAVRDLRDVRIVLDRPAVLKIDGELREGVREVHVRVLPRAATFRVPTNSRG